MVPVGLVLGFLSPRTARPPSPATGRRSGSLPDTSLLTWLILCFVDDGAKPVTLFSARWGNLNIRFLNLKSGRADKEETRSVVRPRRVRDHKEVPQVTHRASCHVLRWRHSWRRPEPQEQVPGQPGPHRWSDAGSQARPGCPGRLSRLTGLWGGRCHLDSVVTWQCLALRCVPQMEICLSPVHPAWWSLFPSSVLRGSRGGRLGWSGCIWVSESVCGGHAFLSSFCKQDTV